MSATSPVLKRLVVLGACTDGTMVVTGRTVAISFAVFRIAVSPRSGPDLVSELG